MMIMLLKYSNPAAVSYQHKMHCSSKPPYLTLYEYASSPPERAVQVYIEVVDTV